MDNSRPKYKKKLDRFLGEYKIFFFGGGIFPLWMPRINTALSVRQIICVIQLYRYSHGRAHNYVLLV